MAAEARVPVLRAIDESPLTSRYCRLVELEIVEKISDETVGRMLKEGR